MGLRRVKDRPLTIPELQSLALTPTRRAAGKLMIACGAFVSGWEPTWT
jgi:hypothetical protein